MLVRNAATNRAMLLLAAGFAIGHAGCLDLKRPGWFRKDERPVYRATDRPDTDNSPSKTNGEMTAAHELFRRKEYSAASRAFEKISDNTQNSPAVAEEAFYYQGECERLRERLPQAEAIYKKQLHEFPSGIYKQQACQRLYDIAVFWLKDTFEDLKAANDKADGKRSFVMPAALRVNLEKSKPTLDAETRALQALEVVHYSDMTGPLADKALYLAGYVKFFREDYKEADHFFTALLQYHKDSELAPKACEMAIVCKTYANGGPEYDGRKVAEARQLIDTALQAYPELSRDEAGRKKMDQHLYSVTAAQADKDLARAEFWERTKHPESAYYIYKQMISRYPNTKYVGIAEQRIAMLKPLMDKAQLNEPEKENVFDVMRKRWNKLWGIADEDPNGARIGASPEALPAGAVPGR